MIKGQLLILINSAFIYQARYWLRILVKIKSKITYFYPES